MFAVRKILGDQLQKENLFNIKSFGDRPGFLDLPEFPQDYAHLDFVQG